MKVFVGSYGQIDQEQSFLEHIKESCSGEISIHFLRGKDIYFRNWHSKLWSTPYEGCIFAIPKLMKMRGNCIYLDVSCKVNSDLQDLFNMNFPLAMNPVHGFRNEVVVFNCQLFNENIIEQIEVMRKNNSRYSEFMKIMMNNHQISFGRHPEWNSDFQGHIIRGAIKMRTQRYL